MPMNMSYCRFENTLAALRECQDALLDWDDPDSLSESERKAAKQLMKLCQRIGEDFDGEF